MTLNTSMTRIAAIAALALTMGAGTARAQITYPIEFTTTFPFAAGTAMLPAGSYTLQVDADNPNLAEIRGRGTGAFFEVQDAQQKAPAKTEVVFAQYGDTDILESVWLEGAADGIQAVPGEIERHHARKGKPTGEQHVPAHKAAKTPGRH